MSPMTTDYSYITVAVPLPVYGTYTYAVPEPMQPLIDKGKRVLVPFGSRKVSGYVIGPAEPPEVAGIKPIEDILDATPLFPAEMLPFFQWIADYYVHPIGEVISEALPGGINLGEYLTLTRTEAGQKAAADNSTADTDREILNAIGNQSLRITEIEKCLGLNISQAAIHRMEKYGWIERRREIRGGRTRPKTERHVAPSPNMPDTAALSEAKREILETIQSTGEISTQSLSQKAPNAGRHLKALQEKEFIQIFEKAVYRDPFGETVTPDTPPALTLDQQHVLSEVSREIGKGFSAFLLAGVTGSGKTEVYMQAAANALNLGFNVLILVPEIALISEIERRFRARFGECVAVLHSGLSAGERYDQWMRIVNKESPIAIGARSAIFAPFTDPGLIIVDEEHDASYKQESRCRYNARDLAVVRAKQADAVVLLGSATPSIQSIYNVAARKFREVNLKHRIYRQPPPDIQLIDLREHQDMRGIRRIITTQMISAVRETLARGEQVLLFLNRRGFASFPVCAVCGEAVKCKNCDITLTLHKGINAYKCHLCGYTRPSAAKCEICGAPSIKQLGLGTEKIEEMVTNLFPEARVARMDRDTTKRKGALVKILKDLREQNIDILVGTQMVAKGHDFPNITLVGIICADLSLNFPDFRAGETTFQILAQVAGRAGRGTQPGTVLLQTYNPENFSITAARHQDFMNFYKEEIKFRKTFNYPPYARMIQLKISGRDFEKTKTHAAAIGEKCRKLKQSAPAFQNTIQVFGPIEAPLSRIANRYRWQILLKSAYTKPLHEFIRSLIFENGVALNHKDARMAIDVDPMMMM
ncbi:MAG: primosomal protein N' [Desulfobacterales bacterium]|nr:primosomal protein N' [Desulfobacterales bacterium]